VRVPTLAEWRTCWLALPVALRRISVALLCSASALFLLLYLSVVLVVHCDTPSGEAKALIESIVKTTAKRELAKSGKIGNLDAELRSEWTGIGSWLKEHRVVVHKTSSSYDIIIEPTGLWCFCRSTVILHEVGGRVETVTPFLGRR